jgi:hypothetical protein
MTTTATLTVGQQIGPFVVSAMTDEKVCLYDASAQGYRHAKSQRWLKLDSPVLAAILKRHQIGA